MTRPHGPGIKVDEREDQRLVGILTNYIGDNGFAPSIRELGNLLGLSSPSSVHARLSRLEEIGWIERAGPRAIRIIK